MYRIIFTLALFATSALAAPKPLEGWVVRDTGYAYAALIDRVKAAAKSNGLAVVTQAGPTGAAKRRGVDIPGNRVIGLFNNNFAVRMLGVSVNAMIEAPVRIYVTENEDGTATLSYKTPGHVFAPYASDGPMVAAIAAELDQIFAAIAAEAAE